MMTGTIRIITLMYFRYLSLASNTGILPEVLLGLDAAGINIISYGYADPGGLAA